MTWTVADSDRIAALRQIIPSERTPQQTDEITRLRRREAIEVFARRKALYARIPLMPDVNGGEAK